jgi:hypothetical protein
MRIVSIRERPVGISRYLDPRIASGGLTTSLVAVVTDVTRHGQPVTGYGFASVGRYAQGGLIKERFAPRLLQAAAQDITTSDGANLDPFRAWTVMMTGEKPGGHGERCVAVGALDMALWDAAAKIAGLPLHQFLAGQLGREATASPVAVYASGGYRYPDHDIAALSQEIRHFAGLGFTHAKIKIGGAPLDQDLRRIEAAAAQLPGYGHLAVDAMNTYSPSQALTAATALAGFGLWWFEDICDPLDFAAHASVGRGGRGAVLRGRGGAARPARGPAALPRHPAVRSRALLRPARLPADHRHPHGRRVAAARFLAARRPPVQPAPGRGPRSRRRRDQPACLPSVPRPPARPAGQRRPRSPARRSRHRLRTARRRLAGIPGTQRMRPALTRGRQDVHREPVGLE